MPQDVGYKGPGGKPIRSVTGGPLPPRGGSLPDEWWNVSGLAFNNVGAVSGAVMADGTVDFSGYSNERVLAGDGRFNYSERATVPDFARADYRDDARGFYEYINDFENESVRTSTLRGMRSAFTAQEENEAGRDRAITELGGVREGIEGFRSDFENDPLRAQVQALLQERVDPNYSVVSSGEKQSLRRDIAGAGARTQAAVAAEAAARGGGGSGLALQGQAAVANSASRAGFELESNIIGLNNQSQEAAIAGLARETELSADVGLAVENILAGIGSRIAGYEASVSYEPADALPFAALDFAQTSYNTELQRQLEQDAFTRKQSQPDLFGQFGMDFLTSFPGFAMNNPLVAGAVGVGNLLNGAGFGR